MVKKILVVDDEEDMTSMMEIRLSASGFDVMLACDGCEALAKAKKHKPDLIISDVLMPNMDGFTLYKELKKDAETSQIPVLILTARGKMEDTFRVMGVDDFLVKPFETNQLLEKVNLALRKVSAGGAPETPTSSSSTTPAAPASSPAVPAAPVLAPASPTGPSHPSAASDSKAQVKTKKVFVAGSSKVILEITNNFLTERQCLSLTCTDISKAFNQLAIFKPDILITEALIGDNPAKELILKVKNSKELKKIPILVVCFVDKENTSVSVAQRTLEVDKARNMCLEAGVTECIRTFEEQSFKKLLKNYL